MGLTFKNFQEIRDDMINRVAALSDKITDFNVGSVIRNLIVAVAAELDEAYYQLENTYNQLLPSTAVGDNLENFASGFGVSKSGAQKATGEVRFGRLTAAGDAIIIPEGTEVSTESTDDEDSVVFETDDDITLLGGLTACSGAATAKEAGVNGNVGAHTITQIDSTLPEIDSVDNSYAFAGGMDEEDDEEFRARFVDTLNSQSKGTVHDVEAAARSCPDITAAKVSENDPADGYCKLYVATSGGTPTTGQLAFVESALDGLVTPAGIHFSYYGAVRDGADITATVTKESNYSSAALKDACEDILTDYLQNKEMGEDVLLAEVISILMSVSGVTNVSNLEIDSSATDKSISATAIARPDTISITVV